VNDFVSPDAMDSLKLPSNLRKRSSKSELNAPPSRRAETMNVGDSSFGTQLLPMSTDNREVIFPDKEESSPDAFIAEIALQVANIRLKRRQTEIKGKEKGWAKKR